MENEDLSPLSAEHKEKVLAMFTDADEVVGVNHLVDCLSHMQVMASSEPMLDLNHQEKHISAGK